MNNSRLPNPSFDDVLDGINKATAPTPQRKGGSRPKKTSKAAAKRLAVAQQEFVDNYEHKTPYRPEPQRLIKALSYPADEQKQALEDAMTVRQLAFCKEYVIDFHGEAAATRAGYNPATAKQSARNLLQYRGINRLIELYTQSNAQKITTVDPEWVIQKVTEIVTGASKDGDKLRGLELLARHLGMFIERTEISGRDGEAIKIEETNNKASEVARRLREMGKKTALAAVK